MMLWECIWRHGVRPRMQLEEKQQLALMKRQLDMKAEEKERVFMLHEIDRDRAFKLQEQQTAMF